MGKKRKKERKKKKEGTRERERERERESESEREREGGVLINWHVIKIRNSTQGEGGRNRSNAGEPRRNPRNCSGVELDLARVHAAANP